MSKIRSLELPIIGQGHLLRAIVIISALFPFLEMEALSQGRKVKSLCDGKSAADYRNSDCIEQLSNIAASKLIFSCDNNFQSSDAVAYSVFFVEEYWEDIHPSPEILDFKKGILISTKSYSEAINSLGELMSVSKSEDNRDGKNLEIYTFKYRENFSEEIVRRQGLLDSLKKKGSDKLLEIALVLQISGESPDQKKTISEVRFGDSSQPCASGFQSPGVLEKSLEL
ncbi:MAG: hypothetical protein HRU19_20855 [Pseudobacteriovorax sp.]|nr:hypothetical protein [Pseudobacteriovorax sp.]